MNDGFGDLTGHSMSMTYDWHGSENLHWSSTCTSCHDGEDELDDKVEEIQGEVQILLDQLYTLLVNSGVMYPSDAAAGNGYLLQSGDFNTTLTAATVNYNAIREDKSVGFHNVDYITAVLMNTIEAVTPFAP